MEEEKQTQETEPGETSCSVREVEKYHTIEDKKKKGDEKWDNTVKCIQEGKVKNYGNIYI